MTLNEQLTQRYVKILKNPEYQPLIAQIGDDHKLGKGNGFSEILLGFVPENYENTKHKILIVGRETAGWQLDEKNPIKVYDIQTIIKSMIKSKNWVTSNLMGKFSKDAKGKTFFNFVRKVRDKCGDDGILWANTFAVDYKKSTPNTKKLPKNHKKLFGIIKKLSKKLLYAQIDILKPDFILFVGGQASVSARRAYFPTLKGDGKSLTNNLPIKYLEKFMFEGQDKPICYRTYHPSYFEKNAQNGLATLIEILPGKQS